MFVKESGSKFKIDFLTGRGIVLGLVIVRREESVTVTEIDVTENEDIGTVTKETEIDER